MCLLVELNLRLVTGLHCRSQSSCRLDTVKRNKASIRIPPEQSGAWVCAELVCSNAACLAVGTEVGAVQILVGVRHVT
jgi:hypothetical protein